MALLTVKQLDVGLAIAASDAVPERGELAVVVVKVVVVNCVACRSVDYGRVGRVFSIIYQLLALKSREDAETLNLRIITVQMVTKVNNPR